MADRLLSTRLLSALDLVVLLFKDHKRAVGDVPYVTHLFGVCYIVQQLTDDENVHLAALLHDVLEDIPPDEYSPEQMETDFGLEVLQLVHAVSYDEARYGKDEARHQYLAQLQEASVNACLVSGADMLHNGRDFMHWYELEPGETKKAFNSDRLKRRSWFWQARLEIIEVKLATDHPLVKALHDMMQKLEAVHQKIV